MITFKNVFTRFLFRSRTEGQGQLELYSLRQLPTENFTTLSNRVKNCYIKLLNSLDPNPTSPSNLMELICN